MNVGGVDMTKTDASTSAALKGATFTVVRADNKADAQAFVIANAAYFNNSAAGGSVANQLRLRQHLSQGIPMVTQVRQQPHQ